ncbi:MAG: crotonase/enoyl-CoA hydratase family protein [Deltaproteobacteria bacterium]|nr:crotonase/enoyl-CoA hydratase family protein [Deltaproteobacteria bacterium]MBW1928546.1 crotonase/enoyl-CoA hydratase family protein [Deltaproteobacteria bacterium]MBW2025330.1 crotonase/enoyl-CoA hydratase family protein [Deltaproteobacteria bacterium]MBW2126391.1 crotonase/enoyl-CoA hydratase family protein [Deltaproteobacteria bacterium]
MNEKEVFKVDKEDFIAWLTLNRPEKRNTMNQAFFKGLRQHFQEFDQDEDVRVVIIKAEGKSFTAGIDFVELGSLIQGEGARFRENLAREIRHLQDCISVIEKCRKPVIAAVHGHCIGGGVDLITACDIRLASQDAIFSIRETRVAIVADLGTLQRLPFIIGHGWFRELALTGRDFTAEEAYRMGLVTRLCENQEALYAQARELAQEIASCSPLTVQGVKEVILYSRDHGVYPGLHYVAQKNAAILPSKDLMEAFQAFIEKRAPKFVGD